MKPKRVCVCSLFLISLFASIKNITSQYNEEKAIEYKEESFFTEHARKYGYIFEEHTVITADEYILTVFRMQRGKNCKGPMRQPPVLLMHGLLMTSDSWLDAGPSAGLAYQISDACYDLWLGNVRGNFYGRRNVRLDPDFDSEFWKFSSDEMGRFDVPAIIDYVLNNTGSPDLMYIGYSQGGRILSVMCSETSGYCNKIRIAINLAPGVMLTNMKSVPVRLLTEFYAFLEPFLNKPRDLEVLKKGDMLQEFLSYLCKDYVMADTVCKAVLYAIDSYSPLSYLTETVSVLYDYFPAGTSARNLAHYGQSIMYGKFQRYDFGPIKNLELYGSLQPAPYNLSRTDMPVVLLYSLNDFIVDARDVKWASQQLPNVIETYQVQNPKWNHLDHCYSRFTSRFIFPKINEYLQKYSEPGTA